MKRMQLARSNILITIMVTQKRKVKQQLLEMQHIIFLFFVEMCICLLRRLAPEPIGYPFYNPKAETVKPGQMFGHVLCSQLEVLLLSSEGYMHHEEQNKVDIEIPRDLRLVLPKHTHKKQMKTLPICACLSRNVQHQFVGGSI